MANKSIDEVLDENADQWLLIDGVVGVGIGEHEGAPCIKIFSDNKEADLQKKIPGKLSGFPVIIEFTGKFQAFQ